VDKLIWKPLTLSLSPNSGARERNNQSELPRADLGGGCPKGG
jgi:hypothetical protein